MVLDLHDTGPFLDSLRHIEMDATARRDFHKALHRFVENQKQRLDGAVADSSLEEAINAKLDLQSLSLILATRFVFYKQTVPETPYRAREGLKELVDLQERITGQRLGKDGEHFAILELFPSMPLRDGSVQMPSLDQIKQVYKRKALQYHPDKQYRKVDSDRRLRARFRRQEVEDMMKKVQAAKEWLECADNQQRFSTHIQSLFKEKLQPVSKQLPTCIEKLLEEQSYEKVRTKLQEVRQVDKQLARSMGIQTGKLEAMIRECLAREVKKTKNAVEMNWQREHLRELHEALSKLKQMGQDLAGCPEVDLEESIDSITAKVNAKIAEEGEKALVCVTSCGSWTDAKARVWQFGAHLLALGRICTHLRDFKTQAEEQVTLALNSCYEKRKWGVDFLFELGMLLGQGKIADAQSDDAMIAKVLLNSFPQFNDVRTVIFNRETSATQKDVAQTLKVSWTVTLERFDVEASRSTNFNPLAYSIDVVERVCVAFLKALSRLFTCNCA